MLRKEPANQIYNADETGLYGKGLPSRTLGFEK
jgi:hypothetical protein